MAAVLNSQVLVLNRLWQPVNVCSARRAITLLYLGQAQVVEADGEQIFATHDIESWVEQAVGGADDDFVNTVSRRLRIPRIIVLSLFDRLPKKQVKFTRDNVFRRDGYMCQYCGVSFEVENLNIDHVIPRDKGGRTSWENVVCSCIRCNTRKANKFPDEARMFPRREPRPPSWRPLFTSRHEPAHPCWTHFIDIPQSRVRVSA